LRYGFEELNLARIQAWVFAINTASVRVLEKAGFKYEGTLRQKVDFGTHRVDDHVYGILKSEWNGGGIA
jgi:ribosomal-protein-alanine N-acetyltransferase